MPRLFSFYNPSAYLLLSFSMSCWKTSKFVNFRTAQPCRRPWFWTCFTQNVPIQSSFNSLHEAFEYFQFLHCVVDTLPVSLDPVYSKTAFSLLSEKRSGDGITVAVLLQVLYLDICLSNCLLLLVLLIPLQFWFLSGL